MRSMLVQNIKEAHEWLQKKFAAGQQKDYREARVDQLLDRELLPHLRRPRNRPQEKGGLFGQNRETGFGNGYALQGTK